MLLAGVKGIDSLVKFEQLQIKQNKMGFLAAMFLRAFNILICYTSPGGERKYCIVYPIVN